MPSTSIKFHMLCDDRVRSLWQHRGFKSALQRQMTIAMLTLMNGPKVNKLP